MESGSSSSSSSSRNRSSSNRNSSSSSSRTTLKEAARVAVVEIEAAVIEVAAVGLVEMVAGMETAVD